MQESLVFPRPRDMTLDGRRVLLGRAGEQVTLRLATRDCPEARRAGAELRAALRAVRLRLRIVPSGPARIAIEIADPADRDREDYIIRLAPEAVKVRAASGPGALFAVRTLVQLLRAGGARVWLPAGEIRDRPAIRWRGAFVEATFASSAMSFRDWCDLVDLHARLKMNMMMVGLYSCWRRADHCKEFLLVPSHRHPNLRSRMRVEYVSALRNRRIRRLETPRMFTEDFFGKLVDYAADRGVAVVPYVSALGHNTLIPRLEPGLSMRAADGTPKGYGFCTSRPETYAFLFGLFDEIIDRYMRPRGLDRFGIGMDEVRDFCECPECRKAVNRGLDNFMLRHVLAVAEHLKKRGMRRVIAWHDMIERGGMLNRKLIDALRRRGLDDTLVLAWWNYGDQRGLPDLSPRKAYTFRGFRPDLGLRAWAVPSAGWNFAMPLALSREENIRSIQTHAQLAERDGAEGMSSYSCHDPIFLEGYMALAEYAWNPAASNDLRQFRERYYRAVFGAGWEEGAACLERIERAFAPWAGLFNGMFSRVYETLNPGPHIAALPPELCDRDRFLASIASLTESAAGLRALARGSAHAAVVRMVASDAVHTAAILGLVRAVLETLCVYRRVRDDPAADAAVRHMRARIRDLEGSIGGLRRAMADVERTRAAFAVPYILNRTTGLLDFAGGFLKKARRLAAEAKKGDRAVLPLFNGRLDGFYAEHLGVKPFGA